MELNIMKTSPAVTIRRTVLAALVAGGSALLVGCAGNPPTEQFAVTNTVVKSAVSAGGPQYAPVEMKNAQDKLAQAENLLREERYDEARRIAEQAEWDARVAERKALASKAQKTLDDAQKGVQQIREEGSRQPIIVQ
ncbi:DUF4398 domain-containing protein [Pseudomonas solani]|jgi:hypothetical protein|uniref:DUF4398 domain-containing protein n=1 Tax=Pseudomonas TaxID=286 RepID=UPI002927685E|nr:DUF4398 domain-containing protein [Pseudomonas sp. zfem005]MDU9414597.1 DUF4398 domain-containing protein [Pseudomonas sp. zfem005]